MDKLNDFQDDINKCSKCGLCQSVCPVYKITGNDCAVSRGKFIMLDGVLKGDLSINKNVNKYLDLCLKCNKCKDFCPSSIDVCRIFACAKNEYFKNSFEGKIIKFLQSKQIFDNILNIGEKFSSLFRKKINKQGKIKILYFKGCVNKIYPKVENATKQILKNFDIELIETNFSCCGMPFLSSGNLERFEQVAKHNISLMNGDFDYVMTDCASCEFILNQYHKYFQDIKIPHIINISDLVLKLMENENKIITFPKNTKVTFHKPCHLENVDFLKPLLNRCKNVEYIEMNGYDDCCGFAGEFAIKNFKISKEISKQKIKNALATNADFILSMCPACNMGLTQGLILNKKFFKKGAKISNIIEFLASASSCNILQNHDNL